MKAERQAYEQHHILTQKIRQTVLTRSGREPQLKEEEPAEVIDLTDKKQPPKTVLTSTVITNTSQIIPEDAMSRLRKDQEYLQQQRELIFKQSLNVSFFGGLGFETNHLTFIRMKFC